MRSLLRLVAPPASYSYSGRERGVKLAPTSRQVGAFSRAYVVPRPDAREATAVAAFRESLRVRAKSTVPAPFTRDSGDLRELARCLRLVAEC
jgi:hypothetical protein